MSKIGDKINVSINGGERGTSLGGMIRIGAGASMNTPGEIVEDKGDYWLVELTISFDGKNRILVPKSAQG